MWPRRTRIGRSLFALSLALILTILDIIPNFLVSAKAQEGLIFDRDKIVRYEEQLKFYLDQKTKSYLVDMAAKERILLENINNLTAEIEQRGISGMIHDDAGFKLIYNNIEGMVDDYTAELDAILVILDELEALSQTVRIEQRHDLLDDFSDLKDQLGSLLESRELYKQAPKTDKYNVNVVKEYDAEVDSVLRMYDRLEDFEKVAITKKDSSVLSLIKEQKRRIQKIIPDLIEGSDIDPEYAKTYVNEIDQFLTITRGLDDLDKTSPQSLDAAVDYELSRRQLLSKLDKNLIDLFGFPNQNPVEEAVTLEEAFKSWRAERVAAFEIRRTQYEILRKRLIKNGNLRERSRMLNRDLSDALLNYAAEKYLVAEMQFDTIIENYGAYFSNWDAVEFYRTESLYARAIYSEAWSEYEQLFQKYPNSKFKGTVFLRLLSIAHTLNRNDSFFYYYSKIDSLTSDIDSKLIVRAHYLAGYKYLNLKNYSEAETAFSLIPKNSKYDLASRYLTGIAQIGLGDYDSAINHFKGIAGIESLPWTNPTNTLIRNNALLKLGLSYYEQGEYENAIKYFEQVSPGASNYDLSLMGLAWTQYKQGNIDNAALDASALLNGYLVSNSTYEALALSAHCKRLLNQPESAMQDFRYVTNARGVLEASKQYNEERREIVEQLKELEMMEQGVLEKQDKPLYDLIAKARQILQSTLLNLNYSGVKGNLLKDEFSEEKQNIYTHLQQFDHIIADAQRLGLEDVLNDAVQRRDRLIKALDSYRADESIQNVNYLVEYPLAVQESGAGHRKAIVNEVMTELEVEQERVRADLDSTLALLQRGQVGKADAGFDLEILKQDLTHLKYRMDRFQTWLSNYEVKEVESNFDQWADLAGFGISDLTFKEMDKRDQVLDKYSESLASIDNILNERRSNLETRLMRFDAEVRLLEEKLIEEQVRLDKLEHQKYFENFYFDESPSEIKGGSQIIDLLTPDESNQNKL